MTSKYPIILGIETSCDDTSASVLCNGYILSNIVSSQIIHNRYGGVIPEIASRMHHKNIIVIVDEALKYAKIKKRDINAVSYAAGPGLIGSLLIGASFAKSMSLAFNIPLIAVNHIHAHIFAHFIKNGNYQSPKFPFLCLTISGGHSQIVLVKDFFDINILCSTLDDSVGELFDKCARILNLDYPGGPIIEFLASQGDPYKFIFTEPKVNSLNFSFSGLKSNFKFFVLKKLQLDNKFIEKEKKNLCASLQRIIVNILIDKLNKAIQYTNIKEIALSGGVSANKYLRMNLKMLSIKNNYNLYLLPTEYTTDNAAMISIAGYIKYKNNLFSSLDVSSFSN
jgi:N6-L-threonylcarbamoyladenine synthase